MGILEEIQQAGARAAAEAVRIWQLDVVDVKCHAEGDDAERCRAIIDRMIHETGLAWSWLNPYRGDGDFAWCGAFAAHCWGVAGLQEAIRKEYFASTRRLAKYCRQAQEGSGGLDGSRRYLRLPCEVTALRDFAPQPGDILLIGQEEPGHHIGIVGAVDVDAGTVTTLEGNGLGEGPSGHRREGVVKAHRSLLDGQARRLIRPGREDLVLEAAPPPTL
ncbi:MAG: CHAP domain-containing protein [Polyangia bacterium]